MIDTKIIAGKRSHWRTTPARFSLDAEEINVWKFKIHYKDYNIHDFEEFLSHAEINRARRYVFEKDRISFSYTRSILRCLLARHLKICSNQVVISEQRHQKPALIGQQKNAMQFNVSHSGEYAMIAISKDKQVGIDIEKRKQEIDFDGIATSHFSQDEIEEIANSKGVRKMESFYRCWTRKEAIVKAAGIGLSLSLKSFSVPLEQTTHGRPIGNKPRVVHRGIWQLYQIGSGDPNYESALAVEGEDPVKINCFEGGRNIFTRPENGDNRSC